MSEAKEQDNSTARSVPTLEEIGLALEILDGVNGESHPYDDGANACYCESCHAGVGVHKAGCRWLAMRNALTPLMRLRDLLASGYVLVSREDRELALNKMQTAGVAEAKGYTDTVRLKMKEARSLLQLDPPKETK